MKIPEFKENHILIGIGGTGGKVLKAFRKRIFQEYTAEERAKIPVGYVYVDSTREMMEPNDITFRVLGQDASFHENEFTYVRGVELNAVFANPSGYPGLKGFLGDPEVMQKTIGSVETAAGQKRRAGRILFGSSVQEYLNTLKGQYVKLQKVNPTSELRIHIFSGLAGGTGSGSIIDVIAQTRYEYRNAKITAYCMIPEHTAPGNSDAGRYHANGFAALTELNALIVKRYVPFDVTGKNERVRLEDVKSMVDNCIIYSNENENKLIVEPHQQLPVIVSDFLYSFIFLEKNETTEEFIRTYSLENIEDFRNEFNEEAKDAKIDLVRSKKFSSFGIKRVVIPEEEIIEYFTYSFGRQALLQLRYNNWNDDIGFRETPANIDFHSFVKEPEQLQNWRLTEKHIILDAPVLESDKWENFGNYWGNVIPVWTKEVASHRLPLNELEKFCNEGFDKFFRRAGVKNFFEGKTQAKDTYASEISSRVEQYMFDKWSSGDLSLHNLYQLIDRVIESVDQRRKECEGKITAQIQAIEQLDKARKLNHLEWTNTGILMGLLSKNRLIQAHSTIMQTFCVKKTELEGYNFAVGMLGVLITKLNTLRSRIETFVNLIDKAMKDTENMIGSRCSDKGSISNMQETVIRFYDNESVKKFTNDMVKTKNRQKGIADGFRQEIIRIIGSERTFARANASINSDNISLLLDTIVREKSIAIHNEELVENKEKLINRNIMEQLSEQYSSEDDLKKFAKTIVEQSGVFLTFNTTEMARAVKNNDIPLQGSNINRKIVLINLPKKEGSENVQKFADKLKNAMVNSVKGGIEVKVDMNGERKNELTITSMTYCFPLRTVNELTFMQERYNQLINDPNSARQNRTLLHTEGTGEQFPSLFVAKDMLPSDIRKQYTPYLIACFTAGIIKYADRCDGSGLSSYGTVETDDLGLEVLKPLADKFTEIPYSSSFTKSFGEELSEKTISALKGEYFHVEKRKELVTRVQALIKDVILPECGGNQGTEQFGFFREAALKAIEIIKK